MWIKSFSKKTDVIICSEIVNFAKQSYNVYGIITQGSKAVHY